MKQYDLIVIGGDAAGMSAASQARRTRSDMSIAVFEKDRFVSYAACGMPYFISGFVENHTDLIAIDKDEFIKKRNIQIHTESEVTEVDFAHKTLKVKQQDAYTVYGYGKLMIATGAIPVIPQIQGVNSKRIFLLRNLAQGIALKSFIETNAPKEAVIIGGGFIGLEMAESFKKRGIETTIMEKMESVAMPMSPPIREIITHTLNNNGVRIRTGINIISFEEFDEKVSVIMDSGVFTADFAIISVGIRPNTDFLNGVGPILDQKGAVIVDEKSRTSIPDVYAGGDCATVKHLITGTDAYMPLGTTANKQGRVAGLQAAGVEHEMFRGIVGSQFVKVFNLEVGKTGFNQIDAIRAGIQSESIFVEGRSKAVYYPGTMPVFIHLTINPESRKIIGGEIAGNDGAALRTDVIATAIASGMTIDELAYLDLGYAPPFSPVWDPLNTAAQRFIRR